MKRGRMPILALGMLALPTGVGAVLLIPGIDQTAASSCILMGSTLVLFVFYKFL